jgi:hypothetical protein
MKIMGKGKSNQLSKPRGSIDENLTGWLQRHIVLGYERNRKRLFLNINNMVLQTIPWEDNCDFLQRNPDIHVFTLSPIWTFKLV